MKPIEIKKAHRRKRKKGDFDFIPFVVEYSHWFLGFLAAFLALYVLIWLALLDDGPIPLGTGLSKSDWLDFLGAYLAFGGTVFIGLVAILQNMHFSKEESRRRAVERERLIRPVISVSIAARDKDFRVLAGTYSGVSLTYPGSVTLEFKNAGSYPICNVIALDGYLCECLLPGETAEITCGYGEVPELIAGSGGLIRILEGDFGRSSDNLPEWFNVNYDDIDGNGWYQTFELRTFEGRNYYGLTDIDQE